MMIVAGRAGLARALPRLSATLTPSTTPPQRDVLPDAYACTVSSGLAHKVGEPSIAGPGEPTAIEVYACADGRLVRRVRRRDGTSAETDFGSAPVRARRDRLAEIADKRWLTMPTAPDLPDADPVRFVDLFCGCGALSLGMQEAARALGRGAAPVLSADDDATPLAVYERSVPRGAGSVRRVDLATMLDGRLGAKSTTTERAFLRSCPEGPDLVLAGPPCQGHSALNNHTRHDDDRNDLYLRVIRFIELRHPRYCLIENVGSVMHDHRRSAATAIAHLERLGYVVDDGVVRLDLLGAPQTRRRHVTVAAAPGEVAISVADVVERYAVPRLEGRTVGWAIRDLKNATGRSEFDTASVPTAVNLDRMRWLIKEGEYDLPNPRRPDCHKLPKRDKDGNEVEHSYKAMYGRLDWKRPAQTITSGFGSMGQGRYVHPDFPRTLTPHEAARLQLLPDWMDFSVGGGRGRWARMIGNAAPMKLSYAFALEMFR
jgi:DNA (cytosine-5)-methyltransferase 1